MADQTNPYLAVAARLAEEQSAAAPRAELPRTRLQDNPYAAAARDLAAELRGAAPPSLVEQALGGTMGARPGPTTARAELAGTTRMGPTVDNAQALTILRRADQLLRENASPDVVAEVRKVARETGDSLPLAAQTYAERAARISDDRGAALLAANPGLAKLVDRRGYADLVKDLEGLAAAEQAAQGWLGTLVLSPASRERISTTAEPPADLSGFAGLNVALERALLRFASAPAYVQLTSTMQDIAQIGMTADEIYAGLVAERGIPEDQLQPWLAATLRERAQMQADKLAGYTQADIPILLERAADSLQTVAQLRDIGRRLGQSESAKRFNDALSAGPDEIGAFFAAAGNDPAGAAQFLSETIVESAPILVAGMAIGAATGSRTLAALTSGGASFSLENVTTAMDYIAEQGYEIQTIDDARAVLGNQELMAEAQRRGLARGVIIGALDAISGGIAGIALSRSALADVALQAGVQGSLAAGGEILGSLAATGEYSPQAALLEALADVATTPIEVAGVGLRQFGERRAAAQALRDRLDATTRAILSQDGLQRAADRAAEQQQALETTRAAIEETATFARDPEAVRELLEAAGDQEISIPVQEIERLYQEGALTDDDIAYLQVEDELTQQGDLSGDVSTTASRVLTLQGDAFARLSEHVRTQPGAPTAAEAREALANREADIERLQGVLEQAQAAADEVGVLSERIAAEVRAAAPQYTAAQGRAMGRLLAERYAARAALFEPGTTAQSLYERDRVAFEGEQAAAAPLLEQPAVEVVQPGIDGTYRVTEGQVRAELNVAPNEPYASSVQVPGGMQRQGIATALYDAAERDLGRRMFPSPLGLTSDAQQFWIDRLSRIPQAEAIALLDEAQVSGDARNVGRSTAERLAPIRESVLSRDPDQERSVLEQAMLVDQKNRVAELRRSVDELRSFAEQQSDWRTWYDTYQSMLEDMFGQDADLFRQILGATSQAASVPANVGLAVKAYEQMLSGVPFTGYLPAVIKNLDRIRAEVALSGRKIGQYGAAVTGDEDAIAIDRHVAMLMFDTKNPTAAQVELGKQTVRDIAAQLGWKPREVQAALWAANIARSGKEPQSYDKYLIRKADQIRAIREAFPAPDAGRGDTGAGAGGAVDPGTTDGGTFEQGPVSTPDTSVAGGLTEKSFIKTRSLLGARIIPMFADLTSAGDVFDQLDGLPIAPTAYFGGPNFSWLKAYRDANIVWAFNAEGVITGLRNKVRALKAQSLAEGGDGRVVTTMLAMKDDAHTSNEMTISALLRTLDAVVEAGRFPPEQLAKAKELITSKAGKKDEGYKELATFPGFGDAQALHDWIRAATFPGRKAAVTEMRSAAFRDLPGMFPVERVVREAIDADYRATQQGDALLAFEIDPDAPDLIIDWDERAGLAADLKEKLDKAETKYTQKEIDDNVSAQIVAKYGKDVTEAEQNPDIPRHPAYRYGMRGTLVGSFSTHIPMEVLYGDLLAEAIAGAAPNANPKFLMERLGGALDQQVAGEKKNVGKTEFKLETGAMTDARLSVSLQATADAEPQVLISGQDYTFRQVKSGKVKSAFVTLSTPLPAGSILRMYADAQSQLITEDVVRQAEAIEGLQDYRIAQAYTAGIAGQWRSSDEAKNKGGIAPVEFVRALVENNAAATLTQYTEDDIKEGKKDKSLRVFQLGTETVQDGGLNVWMAVKTGLDYREKYPGDVTSALVEQGILTDKETALVGVASNELGVRGMATFQVLKGIEEGVTVLNAYKVKSEAKPDGLLPTIYATLGFEEVGEIQFDPKDFDNQQLADLRAIWTRQGWNEADGYPAVAIMKWRGDDALRADATRRFVLEGQAGLGVGRSADVDQQRATAGRILGGDGQSDQGDGVAGGGDGRADPRRYADRARGVSGRARDFVTNVLAADQRAIDALKLPQDLLDRIREAYPSATTMLEQQTLEQPAVTDTSAFREWFGDSKVVDDNGDPLVVYHHGSFDEQADVPAGPMHFGTAQAARERAFGKAVDDAAMQVEAYQAEGGVWHWDDGSGTTSEDMGAAGFSDEATAIAYGRSEVIRQMEDGGLDLDQADLGATTAVYLNIRNPKRVADAGGANGEWDAVIEQAIAEGHDGIVYRNQFEDKGSDSYIAFSPTQIKSISNVGTFDPNDPRILYQPSEGPQTPERGAVGAPRGQYVLPTSDDPRNLIQLTTTADPSTFVHEVGHMFLFQMLRDLQDPRITAEGRAQIKAQIAATRAWFESNAEQGLSDLKALAKSIDRRAKANKNDSQLQTRAARLNAAVERANAGGGASYMQRVAQSFMDPQGAGYDEAAEVVYHELWARGFEQYLGTGSAPSAELRGVFAKFAKYITSIYKSLRRLNVTVSPEVADVFDRLLATEDAINAERRGALYQVSPGVLEGATPAEANELRRLAAEAEDEARTQMAARVENSLRAEERAKRRARREEIANEISLQVAAEPTYAAINIAKRGVMPDGKELGTGKISRAEFLAVSDENSLARMPKGMVSGKVAPDNAIPLGDLATLAGFPDIDTMIEALTNPTPPPAADAVELRVDAQMEQEFGADLDAGALQTKAVEVAQNDKFQQLQQLQLRILRRLATQPMQRLAQRQAEQQGAPAAAADTAAADAARAEQAAARTPREGVQAALARIRADVQRTANVSQRRAQAAAGRTTRGIQRNVDPAAVEAAAERFVANLKVKDATPARYRQAAARLTTKIERAIAARNYTEASSLMEQRALNLAVAKEASMIQTKIETQRTRWREVTARSDKRLAQRYSIDWINAIRVVLEPFGMARNTPRNYDPVRALADLQAVEPTLYTEIQLAISTYAARSQAAAQANPNNPYKDLSVQEALDLLETADTMLANARDSYGILVEGRRVEFGVISDEVAVNVGQRRKVQKQARKAEVGRGSRRFRETRRQLGAFKASLRRIEQWARDFDNGNPRGPLTRYLVRPVMAAVDAYSVARRGPQEALAALLRERTDLMARKPIRATELDGYVFQTKGELIMALLHTGNPSNKRKLLLGGATDLNTGRPYTWGSLDPNDELDSTRWDTFVERLINEGVLTKADMDLVQGIWDIFETTKQAAQAAHKQMYGYYFTEIEAEPVVTPFGIYRGGYAPAITDSMMNPDGARFEAEEVMSQQSNASMFPGAEKGFTQSRVEYNQPLDLDITRIPAHFDRVMKFAYLGPAVRQAARLVTNKKFREAVRPGSPDVIDVAVIPWLQRTVQQRVTTPPTNQGWSGLSRVAAAIDRRVGLHIMAANMVNAAQQITGFPVAAARIPARHLAVAATRWRVNNQSARAYIIAQSPFMKERMTGGMNEASTTLERILSEPGLLNRLQDASTRYGYFAQQLAQNLVDPTVWLAAERHGMEVVYPTAYAEALDRTGDEAAADTAARAEVVAYADSVVRDTQAPLRPSDVSGIEASSPLARLFLKFYSYFNAMGNLLVTEKNIAMNSDIGWTGRYGRSFYAYLMIVTIPTIIAESIAQLARGGFEDLEDEDERDQLMFELLIGSQLKTMAAMVPFAGSVASTAYGIAVTEQVYDDRISLSAGIGVTESTLQNLTRLIVAAADPDTDIETRRAIRTTLDALGLALGLPTNWASKPISYAVSVAEGDSRPEGFGDILQGALTGKDGTDR